MKRPAELAIDSSVTGVLKKLLKAFPWASETYAKTTSTHIFLTDLWGK